MAIVLYDLVGADDRRFSPACWRTRMAMAHKQLEYETRPTRFGDISTIAGGGHKTIPVIEDGDEIVSDSFVIAEYLERTYPNRPSLFGDARGLEYARFLNNWANSVIQGALAPMVMFDIYQQLDESDKDYFRTSREARFGMTLEEVPEGREERAEKFAKVLAPLRTNLQAAPYLGGDEPFYGDYAVFGPFQWARVVSNFPVLAADDPINQWFDRCLDLFDGLGRSQDTV